MTCAPVSGIIYCISIKINRYVPSLFIILSMMYCNQQKYKLNKVLLDVSIEAADGNGTNLLNPNS